MSGAPGEIYDSALSFKDPKSEETTGWITPVGHAVPAGGLSARQEIRATTLPAVRVLT